MHARFVNAGVALTLLGSMLLGVAGHEARADAAAVPPQAVAAETLKRDAFEALRSEQFGKTADLLKQAASSSNDPSLQMMASWVSSFSTQYEQTLAGRQAEHDKAVAQAKLLLEKGKPDYALDAVARAYSLALDKRAFRAEPWVSELITSRARAAAAAEASGDYQDAVRVYFALSTIDQADPVWKAKLKDTARYIRIQGLYTPAFFKTLQQNRQKEDEQVDEMLRVAGLSRTTDPAKPTTRPADDDDAAMVDWREILKGIEFDMVTESARDIVHNYYRETDYRKLIDGGLAAVKSLATAPQVGTAFESLADNAKRAKFISAIDDAQAVAANMSASDFGAFRAIVKSLRDANKASVNLPENVIVYEFMDGALAGLDQFSSMIWPQQIADFQTSTEGEFSGVGIQIERSEAGDLKVISPIEDTAAYRAGIKAGDLITHIDGQLAKGMLLDQAVKKIKGPTGTRVTLTVRSPDSTVKDYVLKRGTVKVASIRGWERLPGGGWNWMIDPVQRVGYVRLSSFSKNTAEDLAAAMQAMEGSGVKGMILDLRSDPGGLLNVAVDVADMFIKDGTIVSTKADREAGHAPSVSVANPDSPKFTMPMAVLVNQFSASASEIVSGALKDHGRAVIVGERSYGKGSVQMLFRVPGQMAMLKLTTSRYYLPSGRCLHREETSTEWGVDPDYLIQMTPDQMRDAVEARTNMDVLWGPDGEPVAPKAEDGKKKNLNLLEVDPQLSAALMLMRLQVAGANLQMAAK